MRFFYDCEFGVTAPAVTLLSVGVVAEDGRELYAVLNDWDPLEVHPWVRENVLPQLPPASTWKPRAQVREELLAFLGDDAVLWAWYGAYDHVALCQLWGAMPELPRARPAGDLRRAPAVGAPRPAARCPSSRAACTTRSPTPGT